ncbi:hypothetical protein [Streptomyces sp. NRRL F-5053]|uniref:hypothetical protein n=1 Tax=Streptomyces sp. NRRL F-5053 TaxID=1463854 RepID=UPI0004CBC017|nr:hypothetical protein [Streptomyces sp. NRRL F-5053]
MTHRLKYVLLALALTLLVLAGVGWSTGMFDDWQDKRSLGDACEGVLAEEAIPQALGSGRAFAGDASKRLHTEGTMTNCIVLGSDEVEPALRVDLRWEAQASKEDLPDYWSETTLSMGSVAPMGNELPGALSSTNGNFHATLALSCPHEAEGHESLLITVGLARDARHDDPEVRTDLRRFTVGTAANAARKFGCRQPGSLPSGTVAAGPLHHSVSLAKTQGSCAAVRGFADEAHDAGLRRAFETPADRHAPLMDCFLGTREGKPALRLSTTLGPYTKGYMATRKTSLIRNGAGVDEEDPYAWATAACPGSSHRSLFTAWSVRDDSTKRLVLDGLPSDFLRTALNAYAKKTAHDRGCTDLRLPD